MSLSIATPQPTSALTPDQRALEADAAALDQLRREVAEAGTKGIKPSRVKLAEFAKLQRNFIDRQMALKNPKVLPSFAPKPSSPSLDKLTNAVPEFGKHPAPSSPVKKSTPASATPESGKADKFVPGKVEVIRADGATADSTGSLFNTGKGRPSIVRLIIWLSLLAAAGCAAWMHWNGRL